MHLKSLRIAHLRNLRSVELALHPRFNIFYGENGSGKTSLLEAVHVLATGRSFRAQKSHQVITFGLPSCTVAGVVAPQGAEQEGNDTRLGVERFRTGAMKTRLAEQDCPSIALLAKTLPVQLINADSYAILEAAPKFRRQFLDWAMFHVEHSFYDLWRRFKRAHQQRNAALKAMVSSSDLESVRVWDKEFVEIGQVIDAQRQQLLAEWVALFSEMLATLLEWDEPFSVQYHSGWDTALSLQEALDRSLQRDRAWGHTTQGPQRADLEFLIGGALVKNVLSRGQSKLFICALLMARALLLHRRHGRHCVFLIDDLNSELDQRASQLLVEALCGLGCQVILTSVEKNPWIQWLASGSYTAFKVKQGKICQEGS